MKEMDKISKLLEETQNLLEGFSSGTLSPVSSYYNSDFEDSSSESEEGDLIAQFKELLGNGDNSKICKFIESWRREGEEGNQPLPKGALHVAVREKCKDLEVFKTLLRVGCDPLEQDSEHKTALTLLLEQNEELNNEEEEDDCLISTLLGEWELRRAATKDSKVFKLIHSRNWKDLYSFLMTSGDPVKLLCKPDAKYAGISPLHEIAALNNVQMLKKLMKKFKCIDFNVKAIGSGNTPLHEASHMTSAEMVGFLLENGAKSDAKNASGKTAAHLGTEKIQVIIEIRNMTASQESQPQAQDLPAQSQLSSKKSADLFVKATKSASADSLSREERKLKQIIGFLDQIEKHSTSEDSEGSKETTSKREPHSGRTILHRFARRNQSEKLLKFLESNDFDELKCKELRLFEVIDNSGCTPLHDAASEGSLETAKIFLFGSRAAKIKNLLIDPSIPAAITADTPLHAAAASGNAEIVELLLEVGADKNAVNIEGKTPADLTSSKSVKRLLQGEPKEEAIVIEKVQPTASTSMKTSSTDVPVKRGPGRPRKYPRPSDDQSPPAKIAKTVKTPPPPPIRNFSYTEIHPNSCIVLVKFKNEWMMLYNQFQQILSDLTQLSSQNNMSDHSSSDQLTCELRYRASLQDQLIISKLPKLGPLIDTLQSHPSPIFVSKAAALLQIEKQFQVHLTGPFGYIDIPKITKCSVVYSGCPLKIKMKVQREDASYNNTAYSNNTLITRIAMPEEQKSPKSFHI